MTVLRVATPSNNEILSAGGTLVPCTNDGDGGRRPTLPGAEAAHCDQSTPKIEPAAARNPDCSRQAGSVLRDRRLCRRGRPHSARAHRSEGGSDDG